MACFAPGLFTSYTHNTGKPERDVLFKELDFEEIGVNQISS